MKMIVSPIYPISDKVDTSHRAGWARYLGKELQAGVVTTASMERIGEVGRGDTIYLYHGMEFNGGLNLQSGLTDEVVERAERLRLSRAEIVSLDLPMPAYGKLLGLRGYTHAPELDRRLGKKQLLVPHETSERLIVGDSHALSQYMPGSVIHRADGKTLHGVLASGLGPHVSNWLFETGYDAKRTKILTLYFGNIDIRHHLLRLDNAVSATKDLVKTYLDQAVSLAESLKIKELEIVQPLPIENEARVLPKTGWYKGTPFYGSWAERTAIRAIMNNALVARCKALKITYVRHPKHFTNKAGELDFEVMEKPRSVHIRPSEYRLIQEGQTW